MQKELNIVSVTVPSSFVYVVTASQNDSFCRYCARLGLVVSSRLHGGRRIGHCSKNFLCSLYWSAFANVHVCESHFHPVGGKASNCGTKVIQLYPSFSGKMVSRG